MNDLADETDLLRDWDVLLPAKERFRGYSPATAALDLMLVPFSGGECIDDLAVLRANQGLERLRRRKVMAPSTAIQHLLNSPTIRERLPLVSSLSP